MFDSPVLPFIAMFAAIFGIIYVSVTSRHRQRMVMIEKGMDLSGLATPPKERHLVLLFGMLMVGIGIGVLLGYCLTSVMPVKPNEFDPNPENPAPYFVSVLVCGGIALIAHHFIARNKS